MTFGAAVEALAYGLALHDLQSQLNDSDQSQDDQSKQIESLQEQIDYLINELKKVKNMF